MQAKKMFHVCSEYSSVIILFIILNAFRFVECNTTEYYPLRIIKQLPEELIPYLYGIYREAVEDDDSDTSLRRLFKHDKEYYIHVKKLKEVNGFKKHNLLIKEYIKSDNPFIYINNPVESKIPNAYLTLEEFKAALVNRVKSQRDDISKAKITNIHFTVTENNRILAKNFTTKITKTTKPFNVIKNVFTTTQKYRKISSRQTVSTNNAVTTKRNSEMTKKLKSKNVTHRLPNNSEIMGNLSLLHIADNDRIESTRNTKIGTEDKIMFKNVTGSMYFNSNIFTKNVSYRKVSTKDVKTIPLAASVTSHMKEKLRNQDNTTISITKETYDVKPFLDEITINYAETKQDISSVTTESFKELNLDTEFLNSVSTAKYAQLETTVNSKVSDDNVAMNLISSTNLDSSYNQYTGHYNHTENHEHKNIFTTRTSTASLVEKVTSIQDKVLDSENMTNYTIKNYDVETLISDTASSENKTEQNITDAIDEKTENIRESNLERNETTVVVNTINILETTTKTRRKKLERPLVFMGGNK